MISETEYYNYINSIFVKKFNDDFEDALNWKKSFSLVPNSKEYNDLICLLDDIEKKFEFNMRKQCLVNYTFFKLWRNMLGISENDVYLLTAVKFVLACCIADKVIDSKRFSDMEKRYLISKVNHLSIINLDESNIFYELDLLFNEIFLTIEKINDKDDKKIIYKKIKKALISEKFMGEHTLRDCAIMNELNFHLLIDKSVEFESAAILLNLVECGCKNHIGISNMVGEIFWIIDDICDFIDDIKNNRANSILFYNIMPNGCDLNQRIDKSFELVENITNRLKTQLECLKSLISSELYYYILCMIWEWTTNIREKSTIK